MGSEHESQWTRLAHHLIHHPDKQDGVSSAAAYITRSVMATCGEAVNSSSRIGEGSDVPNSELAELDLSISQDHAPPILNSVRLSLLTVTLAHAERQFSRRLRLFRRGRRRVGRRDSRWGRNAERGIRGGRRVRVVSHLPQN